MIDIKGRLFGKAGWEAKTPFDKYLRYCLLASAPRSAIFTLMLIIFGLFTTNPGPVSTTYAFPSEGSYGNTYFLVYVNIVWVMAAIIPVFELYKLKTPRGVDMFFSFPVTRGETAAAHFISGFIQLMFISLVLFAQHSLRLLKMAKYVHFEFIPLLFVTTMLIALTIYTLMMFFFREGNTIFDGIAFCATGFNMVGALGLAISVRLEFSNDFIYEFSNYVGLRTGFTGLTNIVIRLVNGQKQTEYELDWIIVCCVFWAVVTGLLAVLYYMNFKRFRAEKAGAMSDSPYGYRMLIPVYSLSLAGVVGMLFGGGSGGMIAGAICGIVTAVSYMVYRRSVRIRLIDVWMCLISAVVAFTA